jgi:hypothetical protein
MLHTKLNKKIKILTALILGLICITLVSPQIFLANTPTFNPNGFGNLIASIATRFSSGTSSNKKIVLSEVKSFPVTSEMRKNFEASLNQAFLQVGKGVYANQVDQVKYINIKESEVEWAEMTVHTKSGKNVKLRYPKEHPPLKQILDFIQNE